MKHLIPDYKLPSYIDDGRVSESEYRAAIAVCTDSIARIRSVRNNYEVILSQRYIKDLKDGFRKEDVNHSIPYNSDLKQTYIRRENKKRKEINY